MEIKRPIDQIVQQSQEEIKEIKVLVSHASPSYEKIEAGARDY